MIFDGPFPPPPDLWHAEHRGSAAEAVKSFLDKLKALNPYLGAAASMLGL